MKSEALLSYVKALTPLKGCATGEPFPINSVNFVDIPGIRIEHCELENSFMHWTVVMNETFEYFFELILLH